MMAKTQMTFLLTIGSNSPDVTDGKIIEKMFQIEQGINGDSTSKLRAHVTRAFIQDLPENVNEALKEWDKGAEWEMGTSEKFLKEKDEKST